MYHRNLTERHSQRDGTGVAGSRRFLTHRLSASRVGDHPRPTVSLSALPTAGLPHNLPTPAATFVGRIHEMAEVKGLLSKRRLVTLTGAGGCGKSRLALEIARDIEQGASDQIAARLRAQFSDGVWWVSLATLTDAEHVPQAVASALGVEQTGGMGLVEAILTRLRGSHLLLLLDNCEHLIASCAVLVDTILGVCPHVQILATSQERLGVPGETVWLVPSLSLPTPPARVLGEAESASLLQFDAVRLFVERAAAVVLGFKLTPDNADSIAQICHRLDGLPLAIELAAARVKLLSVAQIAARLNNLGRLLKTETASDPRHATLTAAIQWSYNLLEPPAQALYRRLSVFAGSFTLEAAEAVVSGAWGVTTEGSVLNTGHWTLDTDDVLDLLSHLVDRSLVLVVARDGDTARYRLLEPLRQYAHARLVEAGEAAGLDRQHAHYFVHLAQTTAPYLSGPEQGRGLERLDLDQANLWRALQWLAQVGDMVTYARLAASLAPFWHARGLFTQGLMAVETALAQGASVEPLARAGLLVQAGMLASALSDYHRATGFYEGALAVYQEYHDQTGIALCLKHLGTQAGNQGDLARATALTEESLALYRQLDDPMGLAGALNNLGVWARERGDLAQAQAAYTESLTLYRHIGHTSLIALVLHNLAEITSDQGQYPQARRYIEESRRLYQTLGDRWGLALTLAHQGAIAQAEGNAVQAAAWYRESLALWYELRNKRRAALCLEGLAKLEATAGDAQRAARLFGAAEAVREDIHAPLTPADRPSYEQHIAQAHTRLGATAYDLAWMEGRALLWSEAVAYALAESDLTPRLPVLPPSAPLGDGEKGGQGQLSSRVDEGMGGPGAMAPPGLPPRGYPARQADEAGRGERQGVVTSPLPEAGRAAGAILRVAPHATLRIYGLGPARIERADRAETGGPLPARLKEMLFYILSYPNMTMEQIGVELWPQASASQVRSRFHEALHRLRRALGGREWILVEDERYQFNRQLDYWFDVDVFRQAMRDVKDSQTVGRPTLDEIELTLTLYQGDFLADLPPTDWITAQREELRQLYIDGLLHKAQLLVQAERFELAAATYRLIVQYDRYMEEAHRQLMLCYAHLGEKSKAIWHYHRFKKLLQDEFQSVPDAETTGLYRQIAEAD